MAFVIKRKHGHEGNFPSFSTLNTTLDHIKNNTSEFEANEIIAIVDFENAVASFVRMESVITPTVIRDIACALSLNSDMAMCHLHRNS